jgi:hypothetical protein
MAEAQGNDIPETVRVFGTRLSARAQQALGEWSWVVHPERRLSQEELRSRLAEKGIPEWPWLWPIEQAFGGVEARIAGFDLDFGIAHILPHYQSEELIDERTGALFVPAGNWGSFSVFLGADGGLYQATTPETMEKVEPSIESFLESQAMSTSLATWAPRLFVAYFFPKLVVPALAAECTVPAVTEASNEFHRWWQDDVWTLYEPGDDGRSAVWAKSLSGLVSAIDAASRIDPQLEVKPRPSYEEEHVEVLPKEQIATHAPTVDSLHMRRGARRFTLLGEPSIYPGKPPSTGDVWVSSESDDLRIDVLERRDGELVNYWQLTPAGSHALLSSRYGRG